MGAEVMARGRRKSKEGCYSQYAGVQHNGGQHKRSVHKQRPYVAYVYIDGKDVCLGTFGSEEKAAQAYDEAQRVLNKEPVNFPDRNDAGLAESVRCRMAAHGVKPVKKEETNEAN
jgi:hypothetical protein